MEAKEIVNIGLEHIHPHPDNPRKDLSQHLDHQHSCASRFPRFRRKELESGLES